MSMSNSLMSLTEEYKALLELAEDPDVDLEIIKDTMEGISGELSVKVDGYAAVMKRLDATANLYRSEAERLTNTAKHLERNISTMKARIKYAMEEMDVTAIEGEYNKFKIVKNGGIQPLKITGEIPDSFKKIIYEDDNQKIRKALESGEALEFAHLEERGTHLKIN